MKFKETIKVSNRLISNDSSVFIIAEAGVNHNGNMEIAKKLIDAAVNAKADAVKFQAFKTENLILEDVQKAPYQKITTDGKESQFSMLKKLELTKKQNQELINYCKNYGIIFLTTPFDEKSLDDLDDLDLPAYKVASTDLTNIPFLRKIAHKRKPIFLSTGMSYLSEIVMALNAIYPINKEVILLQCTANYPIKDEEANLAVINTFKSLFDIQIGYSDHSVGIGASPFAVPMGVKVVEKHFTLDKNQPGPDHRASLSPDELKEFVETIRRVEKYLGKGIKKPSLAETNTRISLQKYLVASKNILRGERFSDNNVIAMRTGGKGISPIYFDEILDIKAKKNFNKYEIIEI
jgi:N-acetylneuraminate synthase